MAVVTNPVRVEAELERDLSRWLWLVKWLLAIPHFFLLAFLWIAFFVLTVVAFFAILFTGRYPRSIFDFNVGVLRWSWRVAYYAYGALGTDRYPPFTLDEVPDYPARLEIRYPERLSRGLVLVKWWLLAIPHYIVVGLFLGSGTWMAWRGGRWQFAWGAGLIGLLVLVAAVALAVTSRYPSGVYDFVMGMDRWVLRVAAYAGLMTDEYPPFRIDLGGAEPGGALAVAGPATGAGVAPSPGDAGPPSPPAVPARPDARTGWTAGRVVALVFGVILLVFSVGLIGGGGLGLWADRTQRDGARFISTPTRAISTGTYALTTEGVTVRAEGARWIPGTLGTVRLRVTSIRPGGPIFVGIARTADVARYLNGVERERVSDLVRSGSRIVPGGPPPGTPGDQSFSGRLKRRRRRQDPDLVSVGGLLDRRRDERRGDTGDRRPSGRRRDRPGAPVGLRRAAHRRRAVHPGRGGARRVRRSVPLSHRRAWTSSAPRPSYTATRGR